MLEPETMRASVAQNSPRGRDLHSGHPDLPTNTSAFFRTPAGRRFRQELAYYEADKPFLSVDKQARRCHFLSLLLTAAVVGMDNAVAHTVDSRVELSEGRNMMPKRTTLRLLDRVVAKGDRSKFIDRAVRSEFARTTKTSLRRALAEGYRRRAEDDRRLAAEWDHLSAEVWARLDRKEERCGSVPH